MDIFDEARKAFQQYLEEYPKSAKAREAKEKLEQIERLLGAARDQHVFRSGLSEHVFPAGDSILDLALDSCTRIFFS